MSKKFNITEQERLYILKKYNLLNEITSKGKCLSGNCQNGKGTYEYDNGNIYEGPFKNGNRHGTGGILYYTNGDEFRVEFKDDVISGYGVYKTLYGNVYVGKWTQKIVNGKPTPIPLNTDNDFIALYGEDYSYKGPFSENGMAGNGTFKFVKDNEATYTGDLSQTSLNGKISFKGTDPEGNEIETDDLISYHENKGLTFEPEEKEEELGDYEKIQYTDELRKTFRGCYSKTNTHVFDGSNFQKDYGYQKEIPELGWAKYEGELDGKQVKIEGCWDKFKIILGKETGERGDFEGNYYTKSNKGFFEGDEGRSNKFMLGKLTNSPDYNFYDQVWTYVGYFINGIIDNNDISSETIPLSYDAGAISLGEKISQIKFSDGNIYTGSFIDGQIDGRGTFIFNNGLKLTGDFKLNEEFEGITYSVVLDNGEKIDNIFDYASKYKSENKNLTKDESLGILKSSIFRGTTYYNINLSDEKENVNKKGVLPKVFIRITNLDDKKIFFEQVSNEDGKFVFNNVPYGKYKLESNINNTNDLSLEVESFELKQRIKDVNLFLKPSDSYKKFINKELKRLRNPETGGYDVRVIGTPKLSEFNDKDIIDYLFASVYSDFKGDTWISDIINGRFEQKYGKTTTKEMCVSQLKNYADLIRKIQSGEIGLEMVKNVGSKLRPTKKYIQNCWRTYPNEMKKEKSDFLLVKNPGGDITDYAIVLENTNKQDIYNKNSMGINTTISKVIFDYKELKERKIQENQIIKSRLNFVVNENAESLINLINEKNILIEKGYDYDLINYNYDKIIQKKFRSVGGE